MSFLAFSLALALTVTPDADAAIFGGNPEVFVRVDRPAHDLYAAEVTLGEVRVSYCGGGYTEYPIDEVVELVDGFAFTITGGDLCGLRFYWKDAMVIDGASFVLSYAPAYTDVVITTVPQPATLTPFTVVQGSISGTGPQLFVAID